MMQTSNDTVSHSALQVDAFKARLAKAKQEPWEHSFYTLLRDYSASHVHLPPVGEATNPKQEVIRLGQTPSLAFSAREISAVEFKNAIPKIKLFSLGMLGPNGPLPIHVTEIAKDRLENRKDTTLVDFLDIFHHRFFTLFYRAWSQAQSTVGLDRLDDEYFARYIAWLTGNDPEEIKSSALPSHARLSASTHLVRESKNPEGLAKTLTHFFGVNFTVEEHILDWMTIDEADHSLLGRPSMSSVMGQGAMIGEKVPDRQSKFRLSVGPVTLEQYLRFMPNGQDLPLLVEWVRAFIGFEYAWDIELKVQSNDAAAAELGGEQKLGWSTWLGGTSPTNSMAGMIFEPENYFKNAKVAA